MNKRSTRDVAIEVDQSKLDFVYVDSVSAESFRIDATLVMDSLSRQIIASQLKYVRLGDDPVH